MIDVSEFRKVAKLSPCKVIKFAASDGSGFMSYNGKYYNNCDNCERIEIEQSYPDCRANHAEWGILKYNPSTLYIYCMTPDGKDYPFKKILVQDLCYFLYQCLV
jgi:hypothetical protein